MGRYRSPLPAHMATVLSKQIGRRGVHDRGGAAGLISYSHDSDEHRDRVLELADRLPAPFGSDGPPLRNPARLGPPLGAARLQRAGLARSRCVSRPALVVLFPVRPKLRAVCAILR